MVINPIGNRFLVTFKKVTPATSVLFESKDPPSVKLCWFSP